MTRSRPLLLPVLLALLAVPARGQEVPPDLAAAARAQAAAAQQGGAPVAPPATPRVEVLRAVEPPPPAAPAPAPEERLPPPPPTDFQRFVETSVGTLLPLYGHGLFDRPPSTFAPLDQVPAPAEYVVGPGDELQIRAWGQLDLDVRATVSREGTVNLPRVGLVPVAGVRSRDLEPHLRRAIGRYYRDFELGVSLGRLRAIQVFVVGQARRPGLYTVGSLSTLVNALFATGGPSPTGSTRRIELRRGDALVGTFDLYDLLLRGDKSRDLPLQPGDVIHVPPVGPLAAIAGQVKTPAIYEVAPAGGTIADLVAAAGGLTTLADGQAYVLERLEPKVGRVVRELPATPEALATPLRDGDVVTVRPVSQRFDNAVTVRGNVAFPFRTAWREGLRVGDLLPDRSLLVPERYWRRAAARAHEEARGPGERAQATVRPGGAGERIRTEVENFVEEVNWDYAVVERLDRSTLEPRLLPFNLRKAVVDRDPAHDLVLLPGDVVTVLSQNDVASPAERRTYFVRVEGEVGVPGFYQVRPGETLRDLVRRAGGLAGNAYLFGAEFTRVSLREEQQRRLDEVARRAEVELERVGAERLARATSGEEANATRAQLEAQRQAIGRLRALRASGRLVLEVRPDAARVEDLPELVLEDGDRLYVPYRYSTVGVFGAVHNQTSFIHRAEKRVDDYLAQAGGPTRGADKASIYVLRADGSVYSRRQTAWGFGTRRLMPNDAIVVPEDYSPTSWVRELKDWSQIFYQFGIGVAALQVFR